MEDPEVEILRDKLAKVMAEYERNTKINEEKDLIICRLSERGKSWSQPMPRKRKELALREEYLAQLREQLNRKHILICSITDGWYIRKSKYCGTN